MSAPVPVAVFGLLHPDLGFRLVDRCSFLLSRTQTPAERLHYAAGQRTWADARVVALSWKAQHRLHTLYKRLAVKRGAKIAVVAVARELVGFLWGALTVPAATA